MINHELRSIERWHRGGRWKVQRLGKRDYRYDIVSESKYSIGPEFKYLLVNLEPVVPPIGFYDPLLDTPNAYLEFIRLANYQDSIPKEVIKKILKFTTEYGPLWDDEIPPLAVEIILYHARKMASPVNIYKALVDYENYDKPINEVLNYLREEIERSYGTSWAGSYLVENREGLVYTSDAPYEYEGKISEISLTTDEQVIMAARAYIIECVDEGLIRNPIRMSLTYKNSSPVDPQDEGWLPSYIFTDLLSVLWLQFYVDILRKSRLYECANPKCKRLFVPQRSDEKFHSPACRNRYHSLKSQKKRYQKKEEK
jgi:hypothetical protein